MIIREICQNHPNIMKEPPLSVVFDNFGESTLDITIRVFLASLEVRLDTLHDLHTQIYHRFTDAGIQFAFPQARSSYPQSAGKLPP